MKQLLILVIAPLFLVNFNKSIAQTKAKMAKAKSMNKGNSHDGASNFTIGKTSYAKIVRDLWKDFEDNEFDRHDYLADSVQMLFPDGMVSKGKEANIEGVKKYRATISGIKTMIYACVPLTNNEAKEDAVCIWGQEEDTYTDGKVEKKDLHEVWWFNKAGKVIMMRQWAAKFGE